MNTMVLTTKENVVVHTYNSTWEVEARGSEVQSQPDLNRPHLERSGEVMRKKRKRKRWEMERKLNIREATFQRHFLNSSAKLS